jgi:hypothetical protein
LGTSRDRTKAGGGGALRQEIEEREKREEEESSHRFKLSTGHANQTVATGGHTAKDSWATSRTTAGGVT